MYRLKKMALAIISFNALALKAMDHDGLDTDAYDAAKGAHNHSVWATKAKDFYSHILDDELDISKRDNRIADIEAKIAFLQAKLERIKYDYGVLDLLMLRELRKKNEQ